MLPFSRLIEYGNNVVHKPWYTGTDLLAFDSQNVKSSSFVEYTGKTMLASAATPASYNDFPVSGLTPQTGFYLKDQWLRTASGSIPNTALTSAWTLDYWFKNEQMHSTGNLFGYYAILQSTGTTNYTSRILLSPGSSDNNNKVTLWNNTTTPAAYQISTTNVEFRNTSWTHVAFVYNGTNTITIYINGLLYDTMSRAIAAPSGSTFFGPWGSRNVNSDMTVFERYRFRSGQIWTTNFNINDIYP